MKLTGCVDGTSTIVPDPTIDSSPINVIIIEYTNSLND